jgi:hypothetical protein
MAEGTFAICDLLFAIPPMVPGQTAMDPQIRWYVGRTSPDQSVRYSTPF